MKRHLHLITLFIAIITLISCSKPHDFSYNNKDNGHYGDFNDQWLLINYWAEWCKPCIKEIPELNALAQSKKINVIGINFDVMDAEKEAQIIKQLHIQYPVAKGDFHLHYHYDMPVSLPTSILINPEGKVVSVLLGPQSQASIENMLLAASKQKN